MTKEEYGWQYFRTAEEKKTAGNVKAGDEYVFDSGKCCPISITEIGLRISESSDVFRRPIDVGEGCRRVEWGEPIGSGCEAFINGVWVQMGYTTNAVGDFGYTLPCYRRKIVEPKPEPQKFRVGKWTTVIPEATPMNERVFVNRGHTTWYFIDDLPLPPIPEKSRAQQCKDAYEIATANNTGVDPITFTLQWAKENPQ